MPDYSKGQIYKIVDVGMNMCYIGSTVEQLSVRMARHRCHYKKYLEGKHNYVSVFEIFDTFGLENCKIVWIENWTCDEKKQLHAREGHHIANHECVNKRKEGRTDKEWRIDNHDKLIEYNKQYYQEHKEDIKKNTNDYYYENKEAISNHKKEHRQNNLEKIREQERQAYQRNKAVKHRPYTCDCGATICFSAKSKHEKSKKHQQLINQNNPQEPTSDQS